MVAALAAVACTMSLAACGQDESGKIRIGIKFDQPGLGFKKSGTYVGFDVDVAKYIAKKLGYSEDEIIWKEAPSKQREAMIQNGDVDMILATYSITDERKKAVSFAGPYFVAGQDLLVRKDDNSINGPEDLNGKRLCSVTGSTSAATVKEKFASEVQLMEQPGYAECATALFSGIVDAVTTDDIILAGLASASRGRLKVVGKPFTQEYYGVGIKKGQHPAGHQDQQRHRGHDPRRLVGERRQRQHQGHQLHARRALQPAHSRRGGEELMNGFLELFSQYDVLGAFLVNIELTLWSALFSMILGVILVVMRISPISSLRTVAGAYVELFKNLPLTIIMVFMVLGAYAQLKLGFSDTFATNFFWLAVTGLSLYTAAFVCESLRSGINTVPLGQAEAARALGLGFMQSATEIILPQAFRGSVAPLGNTLIALLKNSTVAAAASVATETSSLMSEMIEFRPDLIIQIFLIFALGYVILIIPIGMLTTYLSNKLAVRR